MPLTLRNFINGSWTDATGSEAVAVSNPATGETIALHRAQHVALLQQHVPESENNNVNEQV